MRKLLFLALLMTVSVFAAAYAGPDCPPGDFDGEPPALAAQGFAFKGKDFKTIKVIVFKEGGEKTDQGASKEGASKDGGAAADKRDGNLFLAGFAYALKIVTFEEGKLAADLFRPSDFEASKDEKEQKLRLPVPVGHIAINRSQPDPGSVVYLGSLRLNDEETKNEGEFELYLNDHTPPKR